MGFKTVIFSGPETKPGRLSSELLKAVQGVPPKGYITWLTYYLCNHQLLAALVEAAQKGTHVSVFTEKKPRYIQAGQSLSRNPPSFIKMASKTEWWNLVGISWKPHFHEKIYYFSHPEPHVYVGSYNPSDDETNSENLKEEVGDHSISHNVLVKISEPDVVTFLHHHCTNMYRWYYRAFSRYWPDRNNEFSEGHYRVYLWPRLRSPFHRVLKSIQHGDHIRAAVSHLKGPGVLHFFKAAQRRGAIIELLLDSTERRVPHKMLRKLECFGIYYKQLTLPPNCLMHNKFMLIEQDKQNSVVFGSFNWSTRSQWLNHEIAIHTDDKDIVSAFQLRWNEVVSSSNND